MLKQISYKRLNGVYQFDYQLTVLLVLSLLVFLWKVWIVLPIQHIGIGDSAAYATMASSLAQGKGFTVGYISWFFERYPNIVRPEDHWPPLYPMLVAPFFVLFGESVFVAKLPTLIISSFGLPWAAYSLTKKFGENRWAGLGSGLTVLLYPMLFKSSLEAVSDISYTFVFLMSIIFFINGLKGSEEKKTAVKTGRPWDFALMGVFIGLAYYGKGNHVIYFPAYVICYLYVKRIWWFAPRDRAFLIGMCIALAIIIPWWLRNIFHFGDPLFSTQSYISGIQGYGEGNGLFVYWDEKIKPSLFSTKLPLGIDCVLDKTLEYMQEYFRLIFIENLPKLNGLEPSGNTDGLKVWFFGIPALIGFIFFPNHRYKWIIPLLIVSAIGFFSVFWSPINRLALPFLVVVTAFGWSVWGMLLEKISDVSVKISRLQRIHANRYICTAVLIGGIMVTSADNAIANYQLWRSGISNQWYPYTDTVEMKERLALAAWIKGNTPEESVIMDYEPWDLHFHSKRRTVSIPYGTLETTNQVIEEYNVTHLTFYARNYLGPFWDDSLKGVKVSYYAGVYTDYVYRYPDLRIAGTRAVQELYQANPKQGIGKEILLEQWGREHYLSIGIKGGRELPAPRDEKQKNGLVLWKLTEEFHEIRSFPKTVHIEWLFDACR